MSNILFPHGFKGVGWSLFIASLVAAVMMWTRVIHPSGLLERVITDAIFIGVALGALLIICSRERVEDEMVREVRLRSMLYSLYGYVAIFIVCVLVINGITFLLFTLVNLLLLPIVYVAAFSIEMWRYKQLESDEEQD